MRERLSAALDGRTVDRPPCVSPGQTAVAELQYLTGELWPLAHQDPRSMARLAASTVEVGLQEGIRVPFEITLDATAFGAGLEMGAPLKQPYVIRHPLPDREAIDRASVPDPLVDGRAPVVLEAIDILRGSEAPLLCSVTAPFTLACFLHGERETLMGMLNEPQPVMKVLSLAERWGRAFAMEALRAGAEVIVLEDTWASGEILSPKLYAEFALPGETALASAVREAGGRSILQLCGHPRENLELMGASGVDGLVLHQDIDVSEARMLLSGECAVVGNLDPLSAVRMPPATITQMCRKCVSDGVDVLAPSCGLDPATPLANLRAIAMAVRPAQARPGETGSVPARTTGNTF